MAELDARTAISEPQMTVHETQTDEDPKTAMAHTEVHTSLGTGEEIHSFADINVALLAALYKPVMHPIFVPIENNANLKREHVSLP